MRLAYWAVVSLIAGCSDEIASKIDDPFTLEDNGKADGSGLLSATDQQRLESAFDEAITAGEATIQSLETEIAKLEAKNAAKQAEVDAVVARIAQREQELRDQANRNLLLCAFFPDPSICFVANLIANDSSLREFHRQLDAARAEQQKIRTELTGYTTKRDGLRTKLTRIRDGKQQLLAILRDGLPAPKLPGVVRIGGRDFAYRLAPFGTQVLTATGPLALVDDGVGTRSDACEPLPAGSLVGKLALVDRGTCGLADKASHAEAAGAVGVVMVNNSPNGTVWPSFLQSELATLDIHIPTGMVPQADGATLKMLVGSDAGLLDNEVERSPQTATSWQRTAVMSKIATSIQDEIGVLVEIRNLAVELSNTLDHSLATLRALEQSVDTLVEQQREQFMDRLFDLLTGDPTTLAQEWLDDALAARTRELLSSLEWPVSEFARYLVETRGEGDPAELLKRLLDKLGGDKPPVVVSATTAVSILDNTDAQSAIDVSETRTLTSVEVFVDIQHTFIGDLVVSLEHDGKKLVLHDRAGGGADNLVKTFPVPGAAGANLKGRWILHVEDRAKSDVGQLRRWELIAR